MSKTSIIDKEFTKFIFESEYNRTVFKKYLKNYFSSLGDKFWSKYYINCYHPGRSYWNTEPDTSRYMFSFCKMSGSNYKSPIIQIDSNSNAVSIARDFNKMQHYKCDAFEVENIKQMYMEFKREEAIDNLLK